MSTPSPRRQQTQEALNAALLSGARSKRLDVVEKALEMGADANASDSFGLTPMHMAASANNVRMIQVLMRHGGAPFAIGANGISPFYAAVISGRIDAMKLLGAHCLDLESQRLGGKGSLEMALVARKFDVAQWLIDHGADVNATDSFGDSLLARMIGMQHAEAILVLLGSGVRISPCAIHAASVLGDLDLMAGLQTSLRLQQLQVAQLPETQKAQMLRGLRPADGRGSGARRPALPQRQKIESFEDAEGLEGDDEACQDDRWRDRLGLGEQVAGNQTGRLVASWRANASRALSSLAAGLAGLRHWGVRRRVASQTQAFFEAMQQNRPHEAMTLLGSGEVDLRAYDGRGLNVFQSWVVMVTGMCAPLKGHEFDGHMTSEQVACAMLAQALSDRVTERKPLAARFIESGNTILHELIARGHAQFSMHMLSVDAVRMHVNASNDDLSRPLHLAAKTQDPHLMSALVNAGANMNAYDRAGHTPLQVSTFMLDQRCAETAIALGANIRLTTRHGLSLDEILDQRTDQSDALRAVLNARRAIDTAKSIFSNGHPLAGVAKARGGMPLGADALCKIAKPMVPGLGSKAGPAAPMGPSRPGDSAGSSDGTEDKDAGNKQLGPRAGEQDGPEPF